MQLFAYNPVGQSGDLLIWVGIIAAYPPPEISFEIQGVPVAAQMLPPGFEPLAMRYAMRAAIRSIIALCFVWIGQRRLSVFSSVYVFPLLV